jgi:RNase H-fold protein (predicted Holliday junction resolvase)
MILGISLNTRIIGMAILQKATLVEYHIKLFKEGWSTQKLEQLLTCIHKYANDYAIEHIACVTPLSHHQTPQTKQVIEKLKDTCEEKRLPLYFYSAEELCKLGEVSRAKKKALMQALCLLYPELTLAGKKELRNRKRYYAKLFEAVGVATLHEKKLQD